MTRPIPSPAGNSPSVDGTCELRGYACCEGFIPAWTGCAVYGVDPVVPYGDAGPPEES